MALWLSTVGRPKLRWLINEEYWCGGRLDPTRWSFFDQNGDLRHGGLFALYLPMLAIVWVL